MSYWDNFLKFLSQRAEEFGEQYKMFAIFAFINYPTAYFVLIYMKQQTQESAIIRIIICLLSIPLLFHKSWPESLKKYLGIYWYSTLLYAFPFLGTYLALKNNLSNEWLLNIVLGLFPFILLVDWLAFLILVSLGIILGYLFFKATGGELSVAINFSDLFPYLHMYVYVTIVGAIFARNRDIIKNAKFTMLKMLAGSVAHELRTPLAAVRAIGHNIENIINKYKKDYSDKPLPVEYITYLENFSVDLRLLVDRSNHVINLTLSNMGENINNLPTEILSAQQCVKSSIERYPFDPGEGNLITVDTKSDFEFMGNAYLMNNILFNLIQNSLYFIKQANKGKISIECKENVLIFKDTAKGISTIKQRNLFKPFQTDRPYGAGIGLAFCKRAVEAMNGEITCESKDGEYTTFYIRFQLVE